ncbi:MAG: 16S rRNA (adenine(1518)-N(6)/adenine(1519)-N(6))-dimethyltransferase RsmA [Bacteroidales bacterium]
MQKVKPKKQLGQHFLNDKNIAQKIVDNLDAQRADFVLEVGPGMGVLTHLLLDRFGEKLFAAEVDSDSVNYLQEYLPDLNNRLLHENFLKVDLKKYLNGNVAIIGNFPYNISSQIFFKVLDNRDMVQEVVGMIQHEVALRICEPPGSRTYGILSVLLQAYYDIQYLFTVSEGVFTPPPNVKSAVVRLTRNQTVKLNCNEKLFLRVVKAAFNQRRKMLRNSIKSAFNGFAADNDMLNRRPEQLSVAEFIELTNFVEANIP